MWLSINVTLNRHIHVLSDGYVITHSHPFEKNQAASDPLQTHKHTKKELLLLGLFSEIVFSVFALLILRPYLHTHPQVLSPQFPNRILFWKRYQVHHYHAPPFAF